MMIPNQSYFFSGIVVTLYFFFLFSFVLQTLASPKLHHCRHDQRDALLEMKYEFKIPNIESRVFYMSSWNKSSDCCFWEGVTCDAKSGKVISLNLNLVPLNNTFKPNSALFKLQYLQNLSLFGCDLYGEIPSSFGNFSHLTMLDLSVNNFVGQVPVSIGNLTKLRYLDLAVNSLSGKVSVSYANLTELVHLDLHNNYFEPELLPDMSRFHNLEDFLGGNFFGPFPTSLFTIPSLEWVALGENNFTGPIDFGNMSLSSRLLDLDLAYNKFDGPIPESISKFLNLEQLDLRNNLFSGPFPTSLFTIPSLQLVYLGENNFTGPIDFGNMSLSSRLETLSLVDNKLDGPIPESISKFLNLKELDLSKNLFSGPFTASILKIPSSSLRFLDLAGNKFDGQIPESISKFLNLIVLDLSNNKLEGKVPGCLWRMDSLMLSHNSFSSFGKSSEVFHPTEMRELRIDSNSFHGPFPQLICENTSLEVLDLSNNSFNGSIHPCLRNLTRSLDVLNLRNNNFSGILPDVFVNATGLSQLDVSRNRLEGKLPKTLINCEALEFLNVEGNKFKDKFPSWLGSLRLISVLILRSNQFYGPLYHRHISIGFQNLKVIDVSHNDFTGTFPTFYFSSWSEMRRMTTLNPKHDVIYMEYIFGDQFPSRSYDISMEMVHKGVDTEFEKIRKDFTSIDFSRNKFYGKIPESIGLLKELRFLNLSGNAFTSDIPQSLANLKNLEALDLSQNQLSGQIPRDLGTLNFLSTMNFSYNNFEGPIPQGTQFQRQNCSSFMDNPRLNGFEEICGKTQVPNPPPQESEEVSEAEDNVFNWIAAAIAYGPGVFCGLVIGHIFSSHKHEWFMEKFCRKKSSIVIRSAR